jgi:CheY-like chemotaxis protein
MQILIVDSSIRIIERIAEIILAAENDAAIHKAVSYEETIQLLKENKYDTALLDIDLPGDDSFKLLKEIKKTNKKTFVIVLSTPIDNYLEEECKSLGADFFFDKYNDFEKIREVINSSCKPAAEKPILTSSGISIDTFKRIGLCEAILNIYTDTMKANPVKIFLELAGFREHTVSNKLKLNVFRIVQEQMNNILKHAEATEITISLFQINRSIILSISDNGVGFDTGQKQKGKGIATIKNVATSCNGIADIVSQPGRGCILTTRFLLTDG